MKQYRLPVIMHQPSEETENKYMAEIPLLNGCRAWGDTPAETMEIMRSVAAEFLLSYKERKQRLQQAVENTAYKLVDLKVSVEVTVYQ